MSTQSSIITVLAALSMSSIAVGAQNESDGMNTDISRRANRLANSLSPYLLQHQFNPVDWYPWGQEALDKARNEDKPIFLSIGYSACHWCHVMEHECFEDEDVAAVLNEHFVSIKVDREERPDIDEIYMQATLAMNNGNGGWPMSVFMTPAGEPFFAGTYIPKEQFLRLCGSISEAWTTRRAEIREVAQQLKTHLAEWAAGPQQAEGVIAREVIEHAARAVAPHFDLQLGGYKTTGNKFPPSMTLELLLRVQAAGGDEALLAPVEATLDAMAAGGIYDHLGGGICRYSTDPKWLVPHFEKMLYDQALVSGIYLDGYQVFGKKRYADVARGILDYVISDLQAPEGGYYSTRDADSEGLEGKYYIWTMGEITQVLGSENAALFCDYYNVTEQGNWQERHGHAPPGPKNILHITDELEAVANRHDLSPAALGARLADMRAELLQVRRQRVPPGLDDKILTGWNGLMIASMARAGRVLDEPRYTESARRAARFVLEQLKKDGRLLRTHRGGHSRLRAYLSDYAFLIQGLLYLYESTFDFSWLHEAEALADTCAQHYYDDQGGAFFFTADDGEQLLARTKNPRDGAIPSGNSIHAENLLRLAILCNRAEFRTQAESIFRAFASSVEQSPLAYERLLCALDFYYGRPKEIVLAMESPTQGADLVRAVYKNYLPNKVVAGVIGSQPSTPQAQALPLLKGKGLVDGRPTAFVCENYVCKRPVHESTEVSRLLWPKKQHEDRRDDKQIDR